MSKKTDSTGLIEHLQGALDRMDPDFWCRVHGQALEEVIAMVVELRVTLKYAFEALRSIPMSEQTKEQQYAYSMAEQTLIKGGELVPKRNILDGGENND